MTITQAQINEWKSLCEKAIHNVSLADLMANLPPSSARYVQIPVTTERFNLLNQLDDDTIQQLLILAQKGLHSGVLKEALKMAVKQEPIPNPKVDTFMKAITIGNKDPNFITPYSDALTNFRKLTGGG
jgi:hypothetical protein